MKSNLVELFDKVFPKYEELGEFDMRDLINEIRPNLKIESEDIKRDLTISYLHDRLRPLVNVKDFYSLSKGHYISFNNLTVDELEKIIQRRNEDIEKRQTSLQRFKKRKTEIDGQLTFIIDGAILTGYQESKRDVI